MSSRIRFSTAVSSTPDRASLSAPDVSSASAQSRMIVVQSVRYTGVPSTESVQIAPCVALRSAAASSGEKTTSALPPPPALVVSVAVVNVIGVVEHV